jgi:hypothetical protein
VAATLTEDEVRDVIETFWRLDADKAHLAEFLPIMDDEFVIRAVNEAGEEVVRFDGLAGLEDRRGPVSHLAAPSPPDPGTGGDDRPHLHQIRVPTGTCAVHAERAPGGQTRQRGVASGSVSDEGRPSGLRLTVWVVVMIGWLALAVVAAGVG